MMTKNDRMNAMNNAGINTENFFDVNVKNIPLGANVQILVDGKPYNVNNAGTPIDMAQYNEITNEIEEASYIKNAKLFRRWIMAQTMRMMYQPSWNWKTGENEYGWDAFLRNRYSYMYQFDMLIKEMRVLGKLQRRDEEAFRERINFFNKNVVIATCKHYIKKLHSYLNKQSTKKCKGKPYYVVYNPYKNYVYCSDVYTDLIYPLEEAIRKIEFCENYFDVTYYLTEFTNQMVKLPFETPKCPEWKDAFKGAGGYYSLKNGGMFHDFDLENVLNEESHFTNHSATKSEKVNRNLGILTTKLLEWGGTQEVWRFNKMLKEYCDRTNFNLQLSIMQHHDRNRFEDTIRY